MPKTFTDAIRSNHTFYVIWLRGQCSGQGLIQLSHILRLFFESTSALLIQIYFCLFYDHSESPFFREFLLG